MCGPSLGALYMKEELPQFLVGGDTVVESTYNSYTPEESPAKYEAGLQDYAAIVGAGAAIDFINKSKAGKHEVVLNTLCTELLKEELDSGKIILLGPRDAKLRSGIFNFYVPGKDHHEIALLLDEAYSIAVRAGAHCVHSWYHAKEIPGSVRASFYLHNTEDDVRAFVTALKEVLML